MAADDRYYSNGHNFLNSQWKSDTKVRYYVLNCEDKAKRTPMLYLIETGHVAGVFGPGIFVFNISVRHGKLCLEPQTILSRGRDDLKLAYDLLDPRPDYGLIAYNVGIIETSANQLDLFLRGWAPTYHEATPVVFDSLYNQLMGSRTRVRSPKTEGELLGDVIAYMKQARYDFLPGPRSPEWMIVSPDNWTWP